MRKVVSFMGGDHGVGTTMLTESVCSVISAAHPGIRLLLIHAQSPGARSYMGSPGLCADELIPHLEKQNPDVEEIMERSRLEGGIHVISSGSRLGSASDMHPDSAAFLLDVLRERFDLILCDAGCEIDRGFSLGLLMASAQVWPVLVQSENCLRRYEWLRPLFGRLGLKLSGLVINRFDPASAFSAGYICQRLDSSAESVMSVRSSRFGVQAETEGRLLLSFRDSSYRKDVEALAGLLLKEL
ncbi:MAG: hypothetical protein II971_03470 [Firmicutes bacterium]|nr:hypothetical protein [Bacillota bacterium]